MNRQPPRHSVSVSAIITDDHGRALLVQLRDNERWEPPGGVLELGETIHDGLRREVREETGLSVEPDMLTGAYKNMSRGIVALVFRCEITGGHLTANDEVTDFRWADEDAIRQLTSEAYAVRLLDALHGDHAPAIRQHDGVHLVPPAPTVDRRPTHRVPLSDEAIRIGRTHDNDLALSDLDVSRHHAELRKSDAGSYEIIDRGSHNGTFVNGKRVSRATLTDRDVISIGHSTFRLAEGELWQFAADDSQTQAK